VRRLDGRDVAGFIKQRHAGQVRGLATPPRLAIVRQGATPATDMYLRVKQQYGADIGVTVDTYTEAPANLLARINALNNDDDVTGILVELPMADDPGLTDQALAAVAPAKDVDGLAPQSPFEVVTPKAILWLLAAYNVAITGPVAVVGQGRLVGKPLADSLAASGLAVTRIDDTVADLAAALRPATLVVTATGQPGLITADMLAVGATVVDAGAPKSELAADVLARDDLTVTPNPGGVGPMVVAALFDNLLIAASNQASRP
jgi:methylenetetrahydrofolate dehydrogenase (NADP+) / methenyltetrahydrofolate cyclohydrolase